LFVLVIRTYELHRHTGFGVRMISGIFLLKVLAGCVNLLVYNRIYTESDMSFYHWYSLVDLQLLSTSPTAFFKEWLLNWGDLSHHLNIFKPGNAVYWTDLGRQFHVKFMTLCNILSFGHLYVNVIFFNFFFFLGQLLLYKAFYKKYREDKWLLLFTVFAIPTVLFWCSSINKDGWVMAALGIILYSANGLKQKGKSALPGLVFGLFFLFIVRYFYFMLIVPVLLFWFIIEYFRLKPLLAYTIFTALSVILFFSIGLFFPQFDPMQIIAHKQAEFLTLQGGSNLYLPVLDHTIKSYLNAIPHALDHVFFQPHPGIYNKWVIYVAMFGTWAETLLIIWLFLKIKKYRLSDPFLWGPVFFVMIIYVVIGLTVPNIGAIVRYKSEFTALLIPALVVLSDAKLPAKWERQLESWIK
jgi:hypothetical protein